MQTTDTTTTEKIINVCCIGDIVSQPGCNRVREILPAMKRERGIDVVIANAENASVGNGLLPASADFLLDCGADVLTGGNHSFKRWELSSYLEENERVLRPANYSSECPGNGYYIYDGGFYRLLVVSLLGTAFLEPLENPFQVIDRILQRESCSLAIVDFHAESTGEKRAMGYYLDGRVSLMVGTHTHVQTADAQILPNSTGYITDLGMTGPIHSVLGVAAENVIRRFRTGMPTRFDTAQGSCSMQGIMAKLGTKSGKCYSIEAFTI